MKLISHRGNISEINPELENSPEYVTHALERGFDVEVDVWLLGEDWYLGHDTPDYKVTLEFIKNNKLWCHAKNLNALQSMLKYNIHCFWHQEDDYTITSRGIIWTYPGKPTTQRSVIVAKSESTTLQLFNENIYGICSDYVGLVKR